MHGYSAQWQSSPMVWMVAGVNVSCTYCNSMVLLPMFVPPTSTTLKYLSQTCLVATPPQCFGPHVRRTSTVHWSPAHICADLLPPTTSSISLLSVLWCPVPCAMLRALVSCSCTSSYAHEIIIILSTLSNCIHNHEFVLQTLLYIAFWRFLVNTKTWCWITFQDFMVHLCPLGETGH